ncbi:hypothetical protein GCM10008944_20700 [Cytobacillus oceanisediminis]
MDACAAVGIEIPAIPVLPADSGNNECVANNVRKLWRPTSMSSAGSADNACMPSPKPSILGSPLLTPADVGEHLRLSEKTLANWRCQGRGPAYLRVGRDIRYRAADVLAWLEGEQQPAALPDATNRKAG